MNRITKARPKTLEEFKALGLSLRFVGAGVFREAYRVRDLPLLVKFPLYAGGDDYNSGIAHARTEMKRIERIGKIPEMRWHLPQVFYYDRAAGITVMRYYADTADIEEVLVVMAKLLRKAGVSSSDLKGDNVKSAGDRMILVDLGY